MQLDIKDRKIIQHLDTNPKISTTKLAKKVRLSQQVVDYRIKRLEEKNVLKAYGAVFDLSRLGYQQYRIFFQLADVEEYTKQEVITYFKNHEGVYWAALIGNNWDMAVTIFLKNFEQLEDFLNETFNTFSGALKDYIALSTTSHTRW